MTSIVIQLYKSIFGGGKFQKQNIYESMKPFYYVARFYGFAPFQFEANEAKITRIDFFLESLNLICYLFAIYVQVAVQNVYQFGVVGVDIGINVLYFVTTCVSLITLIRILLNRLSIREIFNQLNEIDVEVIFLFFSKLYKFDLTNFIFQFKSYGVEVSHRKHFIALSSLVAAYFLMKFLIFLNIFYYRNHVINDPPMLNFLSYALVYIYNTGGYVIVLSYYFLIIVAVTCRISLLNESIR